MAKYPEFIMRNVRETYGLEPDDTSNDSLIDDLFMEDVLRRYLEWEGIIGYTRKIITAIEAIYGVDLSE